MPSFLPDSVKFMICGKLESEYNKMRGALDGLLNSLKKDINNIEIGLGSISNSLDSILGKIDDMLGDLGSVVPDFSSLESIDAVNSFITNCLFLKEHPLFSDASKLMQGMFEQFGDAASSFLSQFMTGPSGFLEFKLAGDLINYEVKLNDFKIFEKSEELRKILRCMESICALDEADNPIQEIVDEVNNKKTILNQIQSDLRVTSSGLLDKDVVYGNAGLNAEQKFAMNEIKTSIEKVKNTFNNAYESAVSAMKGKEEPHPDTELTTHLNTPTIITSDVVYDSIDPSLEYQSDFIETWNNLSIPSGTTDKTGNLDTIIEIDSHSITETPNPDVNCFSVYKTIIRVAMGVYDCSIVGNGTIATVTQYKHGLSTNGKIFITDSSTGFNGEHVITKIDSKTYTFISNVSDSDNAKVSSKFHLEEGGYVVGSPVCGECFKYTNFGLSICSSEDFVYIRKYLAEAIKKGIENATKKFTASEITDQLR